MKKRTSIFPMALAAITAAAINFSVPWSQANAQNPSATNGVVPAPAAVGVASATALPYGVQEVVKLFRERINMDLIISFIKNTSLPYHIAPETLPYLKSLGLPQEITKAMTERDGQLQRQQMAMQQQHDQQQSTPVPNGTEAAPPPAPVDTPTPPPPDLTGIGWDNGTDNSGYDYDYYDDYGPPLVIGGGGWGRGWRHSWGHGGVRGGYGGFHGGGGGGFRGGGGGFHGGGGGGHGGGGGGHR